MTYDVTLVEVSEQHTAVRRGHVDHQGIAEFLGGAFSAVAGALGVQGVQPVGPPFAKYRIAHDGGWDVEAGFPVVDPIEADGDVVPSTLPGGTVAQTIHRGAYDQLASAYQAVEAFISEAGMNLGDGAWESYLDDMDVPDHRTLVVMTCR